MSDKIAENELRDIAISVILYPIRLVIRGYVLFVLWGWFLFQLTSVQPTIAHCLGLSMVVTAFQGINFAKPEQEKHGPLTKFGITIFFYAMSLLFGFIFKSFM